MTNVSEKLTAELTSGRALRIPEHFPPLDLGKIRSIFGPYYIILLVYSSAITIFFDKDPVEVWTGEVCASDTEMETLFLQSAFSS